MSASPKRGARRPARRREAPAEAPGTPASADGLASPPDRKPGGALSRFMFLEAEAFRLGVFRALLGAFHLVWYVSLGPRWLDLYGPGGLSSSRAAGHPPLDAFSPILLRVESDAGMWAFYGVSLLAALLLLLGVYARTAVAWLLLANITLRFTNLYAVNGEEQVTGFLLLFALGMPLAESVRLADLRSRASIRAMLDDGRRVPAWGLRPIQLHYAMLYLISFPLKIQSDVAWTDGTTIYYATNAMSYPRWPGLPIFVWGNAIVSRVLTIGTLFVEAVPPVLVLFARPRVVTWAVLVLLGLHLGMGLLLSGVSMFNGAMLVGLVLLLPDGVLRRFFRHLARLD